MQFNALHTMHTEGSLPGKKTAHLPSLLFVKMRRRGRKPGCTIFVNLSWSSLCQNRIILKSAIVEHLEDENRGPGPKPGVHPTTPTVGCQSR